MRQCERTAMLAVRHRRMLRRRCTGDSGLNGQWMRHHEAGHPHGDECRACPGERATRDVRARYRRLASEPAHASLEQVHTLEGGERLERDRAPGWQCAAAIP